MSRPKIAAELAGTLTAAIPPRLIKKLDAEPTLAEKWVWAAASVTTDKGETVPSSWRPRDHRAVVLVLLNQKCLHVAAVVTLLSPTSGTSLRR
jgi:hypothetical protein